MSAPTIEDRVAQQDKFANFRLIPPIETYPKFVAFVQTSTGKLTVVALFGLGFGVFVPELWERLLVVASLCLMTFFPKWRQIFLALGTLLYGFVHTRSLYCIVVFAFGLLLFLCARRWPQSKIGKRPVAFLLMGYMLFILAGATIPRGSALFLPAWNAIGMLSSYIWFIGYALIDRAASPRNDFLWQAGSFRPFWGSSNTPFPKGAAYLRRIEAQNAEQLAVTQLKGIKLLAWALTLNIVLHLWMLFFHTYLHVPLASEALAMSVRRTPYPWYVCWESQLLSFFESLFAISIFGHRIIACCRVAGFNTLRNTYRPLSSITLIEFFNRFYYYFKELLVDFFFYPTFVRYFKQNQQLRLVAATFAAAGFGNAFYHFTRDYWIIPKIGLVNACINFQVFAFYCLILATALSVSQLRRRSASTRPDSTGARIFSLAWVIIFYSILDIFGSTQRNYPLNEHFRFLGHLFGV